ncbi:HAD-IB family hydrolase [Acinetobacter chinensis]|uniref:HAD-IB family hydrolase n=1 Tax=Acinetobacter chinensis TaxID=2004650 RepID=A0ABU3WES4_9GAMM|nr:HAD-IB family hydrolase [Acinetobacter chinensis]MDV2468686.1 HAD-IB family hydrolase [Acinetobacter chinensis]
MYATGKTNKNLALFDFDGTLYNKDSFTGFIFYALKKRQIVRRGIKIIPWVQAYYLNIYPAHAMRARLFNVMFRNADFNEIQALAHEYAKELPAHFNTELFRQLLQHQQQGDDVVLVSASVSLYLSAVCEMLDIDLICTEPEIKNDKLTGLYSTADCSCEQKKVRVTDKYNLSSYRHIYAYGNSHEDLDMLELAHHPYMVGESSQLPALRTQFSITDRETDEAV